MVAKRFDLTAVAAPPPSVRLERMKDTLRSRDVLTPGEWERVRGVADPLYREAWDLCDRLAKRGLSMHDPLYHFAGKLLRATIDLRLVAEAAMSGDEPPVVESPRSMLYWVMPHAGGGVVPGR